jgi:hypothetical protein
MILKKKDIYGKTYYVSAFTGKKVRLLRVIGKKSNKIPNGVFGRFITPQKRGENEVADIIN